MSNAERWCNDCAWPDECAARMECHRREAGEVRAAAVIPEVQRPRIADSKCLVDLAAEQGMTLAEYLSPTAGLERRLYKAGLVLFPGSSGPYFTGVPGKTVAVAK